MKIFRLPAFVDNYIFLLHDSQQNVAAVVDPGDSTPVLRQLDQLGAKLIAIFNTHHHRDHVGGNAELLRYFPEAIVYGGAEDQGRIPGQQVLLREGDRVSFAKRSAEVFFVPGHTRAHIAYHFPPERSGEAGELFCGDTLFAGGCGRLFEGTPAQMIESLTKFRRLPDSTRVWCAHEYTLKNLEFAVTVDRTNPELRQRLAEVRVTRNRSEATIPTTIGLEKQTNPFLRWDKPELRTATHTTTEVQTFARLRSLKEQF